MKSRSKTSHLLTLVIDLEHSSGFQLLLDSPLFHVSTFVSKIVMINYSLVVVLVWCEGRLEENTKQA
jgi:hypothetical protein